jgi:hypothetical protein
VWKSLLLVPPSPQNVMNTVSSPRMRAAMPAPAACVSCVPIGELIETKFAWRKL